MTNIIHLCSIHLFDSRQLLQILPITKIIKRRVKLRTAKLQHIRADASFLYYLYLKKNNDNDIKIFQESRKALNYYTNDGSFCKQ